MKKILVLSVLFMLIVNVSIFSGTKTWAGGTGTSENWTTSGNWSPSGAPAANDDIVFNTPGTITFSTMPTSVSYKSLTISQGNVTLAHSSGTTTRTLTLGGNASTDFTISSGASLTLGTNVNITMASSATGSIAGTLTVNSGRTFDTDGTSVVTTVTGLLKNIGTVTGASGKLVFSDGSTYQHNQNGGAIPIATWNTGSTCLIDAVTSTIPTGISSQPLYNLTWNCPSSNVSVSNSAITGTLIVNGDLTVVATGSNEFRVQGNPITVNNNVNVTGSTLVIAGNSTGKNLNVGGNVNISSGGTLTLSVPPMSGTTTYPGRLNIAGNLSNAGTINVTSTNTGSGIIFNGTTPQTITQTATLSGDIYFNINNSNGVTLNSNLTVSDSLYLTSGSLITGANSLILGSGAIVKRTNGVVVGNLVKTLTAGGPYTFEVGTSATEYTPVQLSNVVGSGTFTVNAVNGTHPSASGANVLQMYWKLTNGGITQTDLTFNYLQTDVAGTEANYELGVYSGGWAFPSPFTLNTAANTASINGVSSFSDWTLGEGGALPVELTSFSATTIGTSVKLSWNTATEVNNFGFDVERSVTKDNWEKIGFVNGNGNSNSPKNYSYEDKNISRGKYSYRLKQIDNDGQYDYSKAIEVDLSGPVKFELSQNYPNPFNPATTISFTLPQSGNVTLKIFNSIGQEVATVTDGFLEAGVNTFNFNAEELSSGLYIYQLRTNETTLTKKMLFLK